MTTRTRLRTKRRTGKKKSLRQKTLQDIGEDVQLLPETNEKLSLDNAVKIATQDPTTARTLTAQLSSFRTDEEQPASELVFADPESAAYEALRALVESFLSSLETANIAQVSLEPRESENKKVETKGGSREISYTTPKNRLIQSLGRSLGLRRRSGPDVPSYQEDALEALEAAFGAFGRAASEGLGFRFKRGPTVPSFIAGDEADPEAAVERAKEEIRAEAERLNLDSLAEGPEAEDRGARAEDEGLDPKLVKFFSDLASGISYQGVPDAVDGDALGTLAILLTSFLLAMAASGVRVEGVDGSFDTSPPEPTEAGLEKAGTVLASQLRRKYQAAVNSSGPTTAESMMAVESAADSYRDDAAGALQRLGDAALLAAMSEDPSQWKWWLDKGAKGIGLVTLVLLAPAIAGVVGSIPAIGYVSGAAAESLLFSPATFAGLTTGKIWNALRSRGYGYLLS